MGGGVARRGGGVKSPSPPSRSGYRHSPSAPERRGDMTGNRLKTLLLLAALTALVLFIGQAIGGRGGLMFAILFSGVLNFVSYLGSDKIVLPMYEAREVHG